MKILNKTLQIMLLVGLCPLLLLAQGEKKVELTTLSDSIIYASGVLAYEEDVLPLLKKERAYRNPTLFIGQDRTDAIEWNTKIISFFLHGVRNDSLDVEVKYAKTIQEDAVLKVGKDFTKAEYPLLLNRIKKKYADMIGEVADTKLFNLLTQGIYDAAVQERIEVDVKHFLDNKEFERKYGIDLDTQKRLNEEFLVNNKKRKEVKEYKSGVQYEILTKGHGHKASETDSVKVNYEGKMIDGTVFDSSAKRNKPSVFALDRVIIGWVEPLTKMPVGSKWIIYVPNEQAYGKQDVGKVKPYSTLIFEIELLDVMSPSKEDQNK